MITRPKLLLYSSLPIILPGLICAFVHIASLFQGVTEYVSTYRLYRALYSSLSGCTLAAVGCILQSSLRNPLVDHHVLGIGSGALLASYISVILYGYNPLLATSFAVIGGLTALFLTISIAEVISGSDLAYVLSGISVTSLLSGLSIFLSYYVAYRYPFATLMLTGSFVLARPDSLLYVLAAFTLSLLGCLSLSKRLNVLLLGDDYAMQLGVNPRHVRLFSTLVAGVSSSVIVATFGLIGFIGLMGPHIARLLAKTSDNRAVIPLASSVGCLILHFADQFSKYVIAPTVGEVPAGAIVSMVGAPFFLVLVVKRFRGRAI